MATVTDPHRLGVRRKCQFVTGTVVAEDVTTVSTVMLGSGKEDD